MVVAAPHRDAELVGAGVLAEGGNAVEAAIAVAASLTVVYPHMTGLGGDGFWLISEPGQLPRGIRACGPSAAAASTDWYRQRGFDAVPVRGGEAALTVAGAVAGWTEALACSNRWKGRLPLARLLEPARIQALHGIAVTDSQAELTRTKWDELSRQPGFTALFAPGGRPPEANSLLGLPGLAAALEQLSRAGLDDFYRGDLGRSMAEDLAGLGSPLTLSDLAGFQAFGVDPLSVDVSIGTLWNLPPPTQGVSSLAILGLFDRLGVTEPEGFAHIHGLVEATKLALAWRQAHVADPARMTADPRTFLASAGLDSLARQIHPRQAAPWPRPTAPGDTVWFGVIDAQGRMVSVIQSLYWEFGAGVVLPRTGLLWQNRGSSFTLHPGRNQLEPGRLPFHTLNPALAELKDGRRVAYGTMGGEGQPQTQAAFLTRYAWFGQSLSRALDAPRWLLGRTWGEATTTLRIEKRVAPAVVQALTEAGHAVEVVEAYDQRMGHAGAVVWHPDGRTEAGHDPRSDGVGVAVGPDLVPFRLQRLIADLAVFGAQSDGSVTRLLYDAAWQQARSWLAGLWARLGFEVRGDRVGNLYGRLRGIAPSPAPGCEPVIVTGSHLDTVRHGGWYDGAYGVAASTLALADLLNRHGPPAATIEVVAFAEEEGSRFPLAYWGSGSLAGRWLPGTGDSQRDADHLTLTQAMTDAGWGRSDQPDPRRDDIAAFVELHIEQGIVLERSETQIGIVSAIVGQRRWLVRLTGEANHAGTTPMALRRDALAGAAEMLRLVESEALHRGAPLVATVGRLEVEPNTPNVIPGTVTFTVDARHPDALGLAEFCSALEERFRSVADHRGLLLTIEPRLSVEPAILDQGLQDRIQRSCVSRGLTHQVMPSGAGHDAQVMAGLCPTAMIFIPSRRGISHSPLEHSSHQALADGLAVLTDVLHDLAWKGTPS